MKHKYTRKDVFGYIGIRPLQQWQKQLSFSAPPRAAVLMYFSSASSSHFISLRALLPQGAKLPALMCQSSAAINRPNVGETSVSFLSGALHRNIAGESQASSHFPQWNIGVCYPVSRLSSQEESVHSGSALWETCGMGGVSCALRVCSLQPVWRRQYLRHLTTATSAYSKDPSSQPVCPFHLK